MNDTSVQATDRAETDREAAEAPLRPASGSWLWSLLWLIVLGVVVGGVSLLAARRWADSQAPTDEQPPPVVRQPVHVVTARQEAIQAWVFAEGTARSVRREYLTFEMTGRVTFVGPEKEGQRVRKGEVLAQLDKRKYAADVDAALAGIQEAKTKAEASEADAGQTQTQYDLALSQYNRILKLREKNATTEADVEESKARLDNAQAAIQAAQAQSEAVKSQIEVTEAKLQQAKVALEGAELVSPIDGIVAYLNVKEGLYFTQNFVKTNSESEALQTIPMVVIDPSQYEIIVDVPSFQAQEIRINQPVLLLPGGTSDAAMVSAIEGTLSPSSGSASHWQAQGKVYSVNPAVNPGGRSIQVKIRTSGEVDHLLDGMFVTCWIATQEKPDAVVVPFDAILYEENRPYAFVYRPDAEAVERRDITPGIQGMTKREVVSGVVAGEQLVTSGRYRLVDGAPVRILDTSDDASPSSRSPPPQRGQGARTGGR